MKVFLRLAACFAIAAGIVCGVKAAVVYNTSLVNETALAYNNTYTLDLGESQLPRSNVDSMSFQAVYASATIANVTFKDGTTSTATITVSSYSALAGKSATNTITVASYTWVNANSVKFTLLGYDFVKGDLWTAGTSSATAADSIVKAINSYGAVNSQVAASSSSSTPGIVTLVSKSSTTAANLYTLTSSSAAALTAGSATFTGGQNHAFVVVNGVILTEGTDWTAATDNKTTANSISNAIQANSALSAIISSTFTAGGVVTATSTAVGAGTNYSLWTSSNAAATVSNNNVFYGGTASDVASSVFTKTGHNLTTGLAVLYTKTSGTSPQNLVAGTTYYAIRLSATQFELATSLTNAKAGTDITISTFTGGGSFTLAPLALTGTPSFKWQQSNDNANWQDVNVSSVTMTSLASATTLWDFGSINYRYLRLNVTAPTTGGISLVVTGVGKSAN